MKVLVSLPDDMAEKIKAVIPPRQRSKVITSLLRDELKRREKQLYEKALKVEQDEALNRETADWETTAGDGIDDETW